MRKGLDKTCPFLKKRCLGETCAIWQERISDQGVATGDCGVNWITTLLIENAKFSHATGVAVEDFRNEMVRDNLQLPARLSSILGYDQDKWLSHES